MPHYENLSLKKIQVFCNGHRNDIDDYLPDKQEIHKISREWICNVIATNLKDNFTQWVKEQVEERNEYVTEKRDMNIELDPDIAEAFHNSTAVSCK